MKRLSLAVAFFLISTNASAASSAGASLSNFQLNIISGDAVVPYLDTLTVNINNNVNNQLSTHTHDYTYSVGLPFSLNLTTVDGLSSTTGLATGSTQSQSLSTSAYTPGGYAASDISSNIQLDYKAFTLLSFSADASVFGYADTTNGSDNANSFVQISLTSLEFNSGFSGIRVSSDLSSGSGLFTSGEYSTSKRIKFFFYDDKDSTIQLQTSVYASAFAVPLVTAVPEPETYALMMLGFGLIAMTIRRKKTKV